MPDNHKNFAVSTILTAPVPADTGTSLVVQAGQGALFPVPPFNVTVWPAGVNPISTNAEIVRVTSIVGDTFTILRIQEGSSARSIIVGDQIAATITAKTLTDAEDAFLGFLEVAATFSAVSVSTNKRLIEVIADETNNNDMSLYLHDGTSIRFLQTIAP